MQDQSEKDKSAIYQEDCFFLGLSKKSLEEVTRRSHKGCFIKKLSLEISQYSQEITRAGVSFNKVKKTLQHRCFPIKIAKFLRPFLQNTSWRLLLEVESENISQW